MSSDRIVIGMVTTDYTPAYGGMGRHVESLVSGLHGTFDVPVYSRHKRPLLYRLGKNLLFSFNVEPALAYWIKRECVGLLHVHTGPGGVLLHERPSEIPLIVTANHTYALQAKLPGQWWKRMFIGWERQTYRIADKIICVSEDTAESVVNEYGIPKDKVIVIHCGFDLAPWVAADKEYAERHQKDAVFVGRKDGRKGFDLLRAAWEIVRKKRPDALLHVVGFRGKAQDGIIYHGRVSSATLHELVGQSRMLIAPSRMEGFGLAAAEAIAAGTPCIASDVPGLRRIVRHQQDGLLVQPEARALADGIATLFKDEVLWPRLHAGARQGRGRFESKKEVEAHAMLYSAVYSGTG